jgi:serine/threonine protein kinase
MTGTGELIGQQVGPYLIEALLGSGGMGTVYRAQDLRLVGRVVAIKIISVSEASGPHFVIRFQREARALARLDHPNILPLWDAGQAGSYLYLVTPVVEGGSLRDLRMRLGGSVPPAQAILLTIQVADALQHAHERGIIHRDVKPGNLLLHSDGRVMLADFGIARSVSDRPEISLAELAIGTPHYIAPEQALGDQVDSRADIYSLGAVLYELLSGRPPYTAESTTRVLVQMMDGPPLPLCQVNPALAPAVEAVVMRALARRPDERYPTASAFAADLRKLLMLGTLLASSPIPAQGIPATSTVVSSRGNALAQPAQPGHPPGAAPALQPTHQPSPAAAPLPAQPVPGCSPWRPPASEPPSSRPTYLPLVVTALVILSLALIFAAALALNR